jgi:hypothetical protein
MLSKCEWLPQVIAAPFYRAFHIWKQGISDSFHLFSPDFKAAFKAWRARSESKRPFSAPIYIITISAISRPYFRSPCSDAPVAGTLPTRVNMRQRAYFMVNSLGRPLFPHLDLITDCA